ncbi:MAG: SH3 domain-containing protein [Candidatus Delongbacteria bacterium]|nr:SH3 domain-containing protein [Candidatus Delongbacteria bacterium]
MILLFFTLSNYAQDSYITTVDLNLRSGAGQNYKTITVIAKGDTIKLLENSGEYWAKIQYQDKIGYSAKQYLQKIDLVEEGKHEAETESGNGFLVFIICLLIVIVTSIILKKSGEKYRYKSTATLLSFFFGAFGFQKFYLGEKNKGTYSILFCWSFIPSLVGLIDFIKYVVMNEAKFNDLYNYGKRPKPNPPKASQFVKPERKSTIKVNVQQTTYSTQPKQKYVDESIIDVNSENLDLSVEKNIGSNSLFQEPPFWSHSYVYSYDELRYANKEQKKFYFYFKNKVLAGEYVDIKGNTNYAFILYFDLLNEYQSHRDIKLLDEQFKLLAEICPKTRNYSFRSLQDELRKGNDSYSVDKLKDLEEPNYLFENGYTDYNPDLYKLGNQYKEKLGLTKQEINWLNKFYNPSNVFTSIEGCSLAVINIYLAVFNELNLQLKDINSSIDKELDKIFEKVCEIENLTFSDYYKGEKPYWAVGRFHESFFITFYKTIENLVREKYGHKRKLSFEYYYSYTKSAQYIDETIGNQIQKIIIEKTQGLNEPDLETRIALNTQNVNRWKIEFDILTNDFKKEEQEKFIDAIITLEETNQKNANIENIFFDASKFIAKYDKVQALKYYAKYIYYDLKSVKFDNKEFSKTVQKSLFKSEEQINDFKEIIVELIATKDIQTALEKISKIYAPKRKKIQLDLSEIEEVEQKHEGTVELLNEYLKDEKTEHETEIVDNSDDNTEITIVSSTENNSIFISEISMGQVQEELVKMIINKSFEIHQDEVDKYATANGMFKNQLIDSINEACEEYLDGEALIEEEDVNYIIEESYYKEIAK